MPKLTRYNSFEKLKAESKAAGKKNGNLAKDLKDIERFINQLKQSSTLNTSKRNQSGPGNE